MQPEEYLDGVALLIQGRQLCTGGRACGTVNDMQWCQEAITLARNGFDKARIFCIVLECGAKLLQSRVQASLEIDMGACRPQGLAEIVSLYNFAVSPKEHGENSKRLLLDFDTYALAAQGRAGQVRFEQTKFHD